MITLTPTCITEVKRLLVQEKKEDWGLRIGVKGGGCSGLEYTLAFDEKPAAKDNIFDYEGLKVYCDPKSYLFLNGMVLDFSTELLQGGFRFENPNAKKTCSCGTSFSA